MKLLVQFAICCLLTSLHSIGFAQGEFLLNNFNAPTRILSMDGSFANGSQFYGQMFLGKSPEELSPFYYSLPHRPLSPSGSNGGFWTKTEGGAVIVVPGIPGGQVAYAQFYAWDAGLWGTTLQDVPLDQIGMTDVGIVPLYSGNDPLTFPRFTQPAIIPIPEPSSLVLALFGLSGLTWRFSGIGKPFVKDRHHPRSFRLGNRRRHERVLKSVDGR